MVRIIYLIPLLGSMDGAQLTADRTRIGNLFDTGRQKIILNRSTTDGQSTIDVMSGIADFDDIDDSAKKVLTISTTADAPLRIPTQTVGDNSTKAASTAYVDAMAASGGTYGSGITAAGANQATATILTKTNNSVDTVAAGTGVVPNVTATPGFKQTVQNKGANDLLFYPFLGNNFLGQAANDPITISSGNQAAVLCYSTGELTLI